MVDNQLTPLNLYFHTNKQEWRARYCELDLKKTKHFSCNRYGHNRSYFLATLYLTSIKLYQLPLTADDILSWFSIIKDFKSLDDTPQKVIPKSLTHNKPLDNKLLDNKLPHNKLPDNKLLDNKLLEKLMLDVRSKSMFECAVESVASREYVMGVTFPVPELCKQSICNEFNNLVSLLKCYKVEGDRGKPKPEPQTHNEQLTLQDLFSHVMNISHNPIYPFNTHTVDSMENTVDIVDTVDSVDTVEVGVENTVDSAATIDNTVDNSLDTIESTVDNSLDTVEDVAGAVGPNAVTEDISKLIQMNNKKYNKVYKLLNHFILKLRDSTEEFGPTCDNIPQDYEHIAAVDVDEEEISGLLKICKSNEEVIEEMSRGFRGNARYRNNTETFINTFNHLFKQDTFHNTQSYSNSVGSGDSVGGVESVSDDDVNSLQQYFRHNSLYNLTSFRVR
uniref:Uncharacterized protein n=1 Tax=Theileria parva TaxID=5875 RepID=Q4MYL6_THEPA|eukprot:XP_762949.1 hypothetical protein [Theileria parva strain Muguga]